MSAIIVIAAVVIVVMLLVMAGLSAVLPAARKAGGKIVGKRPLTANEQPMYFRLAQALPEHVILAQVAFSAALATKDRATRNTFDRKVADFVVCTKAFDIIAFVELDDSSHAGRKQQDARRDALLQNAGYRVLRYARVPDVAVLRADVLQAAAPEQVAHNALKQAGNA